MLDIAYYVASSLDGYIATTDGGLDWLAPFEASVEDYGYAAFFASVDAVIVGSRTYEQALGFDEWPYAGKPTWVLSGRPLVTHSSDVTLTSASPREVAEMLEARGVRHAWLVGGGALAGSFEGAGLITEYVVSVMPVILGSGIRLFGGTGSQHPLRLVSATAYPDGVQQLRYVLAEGR